MILDGDQCPIPACDTGAKDHARNAVWRNSRVLGDVCQKHRSLAAKHLWCICGEQDRDGSIG